MSLIGVGRYGNVFKDGNLAYKVIKQDINVLEIDVLRRLNHANIMHSESVEWQSELVITMPLADCTLREITYVRRMRLLNEENKMVIIGKIASAINFLHSNNILHLDISLSNIVVKNEEPYLIDFGSSVLVDNIEKGVYLEKQLTSVYHRAPEIIEKKIFTNKVDVWSFGMVIMYFLSEIPEQKIIPYIEDADLEILNNAHRNFIFKPAFLERMLKLDPVERDSMADLKDVFNYENGSVCMYKYSEQYHSNHREVLLETINKIKVNYGKYPVLFLFLVVDLYNRCVRFFKEFELLFVADACITMCSKALGYKVVDEVVNNSYEKRIIYFLEGILFTNKLYQICKQLTELKYCFDHIIMNEDSSLYNRTCDIIFPSTFIFTELSVIPDKVTVERFFN